ncbi:transglycosylase SLT domain-containing protein [Nocardia sp. X0981]
MKPANYWEVKLEPPKGASAGLRAVVDAADQAIQNCADLLATGDGQEARNMLKLFEEKKLVEPGDNSLMAADYKDKMWRIDEVRRDLEQQHQAVNLTAGATYDTSSAAFGAIKTEAQQLEAALKAPYRLREDGTLPPNTEYELLEVILDSVEYVYAQAQGASDTAMRDAGSVQTSTPNYGSAAPSFPVAGSPDYGPAGDDAPEANYEGPASEADYARYPGSMTIDQAIEGALDALGITDPEARENWMRGYRVLIERESGGDPNIINNWDSNAASGQNSRGLTQTIPSTFEAYHQPGTSTNIYDPVANVAASMNYVMDRYDVSPDGSNLQQNVQQADPGRPAKGY